MHVIEAEAVQLAAAQHGVFAGSQVRDLTKEFAQSRVRHGRWKRRRTGIYTIAGTPKTWEQDLWIELLAAGPGSAVGRRSAARIDHLTARFGDAIDIVQPEASVPKAKPRTSRRTSRLLERHVTVVHGFPITTIERTLFDLAGLTSQQRRRRGWIYVPEARVERLLDDALVRNRTTVAKLTKVFIELAGRGRPGTSLMRRLLEARTESFVPTASDLEDLFVAFVERFDLPRPKRRVDVGTDCDKIGEVDFLFEHAKLIVELDGRVFHEQRMVQRNDRRRDLKLLRAGWRFLRLTWLDLRDDPEEIAELLRDVVTSAGARRCRSGDEHASGMGHYST